MDIRLIPGQTLDIQFANDNAWVGYRALIHAYPDDTFGLNFCFDEWENDDYEQLVGCFHFSPPVKESHPEGGKVPSMLRLSEFSLTELHEAIHRVIQLDAHGRPGKGWIHPRRELQLQQPGVEEAELVHLENKMYLDRIEELADTISRLKAELAEAQQPE